MLEKDSFDIPEFIPETYIQRTRVLAKFQSADSYADLIRVEAKQGQGKTIAVAQYLSSLKNKTIWYRIDEYDNDFQSFMESFCSSLGQKFPKFKKLPLWSMVKKHLIKPADAKIYADLINGFFNSNISKKKTYITFDDFYIIEKSNHIKIFFSSFLKNLSKQLKVILISRTPVDQSISSLALSEFIINDEDLKIDFNEAVKIADRFSKFIPLDKIQEIRKISDGWAIGLVAEVFFYSGEKSHKRLVRDQLLKTLSSKKLEILAPLSQLESITPAIARQITGLDQIEDFLESLYKKNPFFYKNQNNNEYFFHHLFREALDNKFKKLFSLEQRKELLLKVSEIYLKQGHIIKSLRFIHKTNDLKLFELILKDNGVELYKKDKVSGVYEIIKEISLKEALDYPWLSLFMGSGLLDYDPSKAILFIKNSCEKMDNDYIGKILSFSKAACFHITFTGNFTNALNYLNKLKKLNQLHGKKLPDLLKFRVLETIALGNILIFFDINSAFSTLKEASRITKKLNNHSLNADLLISYCYCYITKGSIIETNNCANRLFKFLFSPTIGSHTRHLILLTLLNVSAVEGDLFTYQFLRKNLDQIITRHSISQSLSKAFLNIWDAVIHILNGNYHEAEQSLEKTNEFKSIEKVPHLKCRYHYYKSYILALNKEKDKALDHFHEAEEICSKSSSIWYKATSSMILGASLSVISADEKAEKKITESASYSDQIHTGRNLLAFNCHLAWVYLRKKENKNLENSLTKIGKLLSLDKGLYCFSIRKDMIIKLSQEAVSRNIYPTLFQEWCQKYTKHGFNDKNKPIPLMEIRTFGEFSFYLDDKKIFSIDDLQPKEILIFKLILFKGEKGIDFMELSNYLEEAKMNYSRASIDKTNSRIRQKLAKFMAPYEHKDYFKVNKGSVALKNIHVDFNNVLKLISDGNKAYNIGNYWTAQSLFRQALTISSLEFGGGYLEKRKLLYSFYNYQLAPELSIAAEKWAKSILETDLLIESDLDLIENVFKKNSSDIKIAVLLNRINSRNKNFKRTRNLLEIYKVSLEKEGFSRNEKEEFLNFLVDSFKNDS